MSLPSPSPDLGITKYELREEIGHGGMATVYRARDRRLDRDVALKVIHRHLRDNPDVRARFASEALTVARVKHPNIVEVYDVSEETESERYLVVELVRGMTLRQLLAEVGPLPPEVAASIGYEVACALAHAHQHGVIHRDIKPENVLLSTDGGSSGPVVGPRVKLTDFGIAKLLDAQGVTHTGQVLGSPAHMAPEQIEGGDVDARSDVFGAGVLLYEMLTGTLPFEGKNPAQVLRRVLEGGSIPPDRLRPEIGSTYGQIVSRALEREPSARHSTATELALALQKELEGLGVNDPRQEIATFLDHRAEYLAEHGARIVDHLSRRAQLRRDQGDVVGSSVDYNRALAYRPDDTILLAEVAGLMRRRRARKQLEFGLWIVGIGLLFLGLAFVSQDALRDSWQRKPEAKSKLAPPGPAASAKTEVPARPAPVREPAETSQASEPAAEPVKNLVSRSNPKKSPPVSKPERAADAGVRAVRTPIAGPQNARVRIDGEVHSWFQVHQLSYGPHTFEFIPPNAECCDQPPPVTVEIVAGDGPQLVRGTISFKDSVLLFDGPLGARATCGAAGTVVAGSSKSIRMSRPEEHLVCTIFPAPGSGRETRQINVDLRPGRTFTLVER